MRPGIGPRQPESTKPPEKFNGKDFSAVSYHRFHGLKRITRKIRPQSIYSLAHPNGVFQIIHNSFLIRAFRAFRAIRGFYFPSYRKAAKGAKRQGFFNNPFSFAPLCAPLRLRGKSSSHSGGEARNPQWTGKHHPARFNPSLAARGRPCKRPAVCDGVGAAAATPAGRPACRNPARATRLPGR